MRHLFVETRSVNFKNYKYYVHPWNFVHRETNTSFSFFNKLFIIHSYIQKCRRFNIFCCKSAYKKNYYLQNLYLQKKLLCSLFCLLLYLKISQLKNISLICAYFIKYSIYLFLISVYHFSCKSSSFWNCRKLSLKSCYML